MERRLTRLLPPSLPLLARTLGLLLSLAFAALSLAPPAVAQDRRPVDEPPRSRIFGRIVDANGVGVRGAKVEIHTVDGPWRPGEKRESFEVASDDAGKFELSVPTPTSDWISLWVRPQPYLDIAARDFGPAGGRKQPRLKSGDNDLGTFQLAPTGAIAGRVTGAQGEPVAGAELRLAGSFPGGLGRQARSNERGEYEIGHVPPGAYVIEALAEGFQLSKSAETAVVVGKTTAGIDFKLARAMSISGVVVDESGVGIANARVWGWPQGSGAGSGARTDAQGRFVVHLKQSEPHIFEVEAEGFAKLDSLFEDDEPAAESEDENEDGFEFGLRRGKHHAPGATDVRLVLRRPALTRFVVLDAATSAPVTEYAVRLEWKVIGNMVRGGGEPEYPRGQHPDGEFECEADPLKHTYVITAPGYGPARGEIVHDSPTTRRCIVRVSRGGGLRGQVLVDGKPVEDAKVILRETTLAELWEEPVEDENDAYWNDWDGSVEPFLFDEGERESGCDAEGRFEFDSLEAGDYRLEITTRLGERRSIEPVKVVPGTPTDLGRIELLLAAVLEGRVITPSGTSPAGVRVRATTFDVARSATTDAEGRFRIPALPAGRAHVYVDSKPGVLVWSPGQHFDLAPAQTLDVLLDASAYAGASIALVARIDGKPAARLNVYLRSATDEKRFARLNDTDPKGAASGWVAAIGEADVLLRASSRMPVATLPKAALLTPGADVKLDLDLAVGQLAFEWPELPAGEKLEQVEFTGRRADRTETASPVWFRRSMMPDRDIVRRRDNRCEFQWVEPGDWDWTLRVISSTKSDSHIERSYRKPVSVLPGALAECVTTESERVPPEPDED